MSVYSVCGSIAVSTQVCDVVTVDERSSFSMSATEIENAPSQETEREDYVSSDSSSESDIEDLCKEVLEEDGEKEMILVPRSVSSTNSVRFVLTFTLFVSIKTMEICQPGESAATSDQLTTDEVQVYSGLFIDCVASLKKEKLIMCSPRGQKITGLLDHLEHDMCVADTTYRSGNHAIVASK